MRKILASLALLLVCAAAPAAAQRSGPSAQLDAASAPAATSAADRAPPLFPSTDEVRTPVHAREEGRDSSGSRTMGTSEMIALIAAIVVGVVIAAVVLN